MKPEILCIFGPTATGKTALAVRLCKALDGEAVSCDSMQVYRGMPIGSAQPTEAEQDGVPHHMLSVFDPSETCTAGLYAGMAAACVRDILARGKRPVVVGGAGLYAAALLGGVSLDAPSSDPALRAQLERRADTEGLDALRAELRGTVPGAEPPLDRRRVIRAMEILLSGGTAERRPPSASLAGPDCPWRPILFGLNFPVRADLYARIDARTDAMFAAGLPAEALSAEVSGGAAQAIGHKEILAAVRAGNPPESARDIIKRVTRRYAKRQLTWFRRDPSLLWLDASLPVGELARRVMAALPEGIVPKPR